ncbi:MAG TPA: Do family serine endopeptidase [Chlamydiales bacterium]|nr:Do family serine endopeptidase [Chlamydiales bacterium]
MLLQKKWIITFVGMLAIAASGFSAEAKNKGKATSAINLLEETSQAFTQIAEKAMPATVFIKTQISVPQQDFMNPFDMFGDDFFRRFFQQQQPFQGQPGQPPQQQLSGGSGFLVSADGFIVTNNHVIKDAAQITVTLGDGKEYPATVKGSDPRTDLAVIKIEEKNLPYLSFGDSDVLKIGEWVVAIGNPFGLEATLTVGVVSAKGRQDLGIASYEDFIQTDAAINPGNSGGPLLNLQGQLIGVNTAIFSRSGGYMGIGLAIPSKMAQNVVDQIVNNGIVKRAYLGILLQPMDKELSDAMGLEKQEGILISDVVKDSPAAKAGLLQGDVVLQYNDKPVKNVAKFRNDIALMNPNTPIKLKILRNSKPMTLSVTLGSQSEGEVIAGELPQKLGIELENLTPEWSSKLGFASEVAGVVISKVKPGAPAALAGLRPGYLITGVAVDWSNQKPVHNTAEFESALKELGDKKHIILIARYQNYQRYYTIKLN